MYALLDSELRYAFSWLEAAAKLLQADAGLASATESIAKIDAALMLIGEARAAIIEDVRAEGQEGTFETA